MLNFSPLSSSQYSNLKFSILSKVEENSDPKERIYFDSKGIPSIGIGMNLRVGNVFDEIIIETFGVEKSGTDKKYYDEINSIIKSTSYSNASQMQAALDQVMLNRYNDPVISKDKRSDFAFENNAEIQNVLHLLINLIGKKTKK